MEGLLERWNKTMGGGGRLGAKDLRDPLEVGVGGRRLQQVFVAELGIGFGGAEGLECISGIFYVGSENELRSLWLHSNHFTNQAISPTLARVFTAKFFLVTKDISKYFLSIVQ